MTILRFLVAVLLACAHSAHAQHVYRCLAPDGAVSFQQQPCAGAGERVPVVPINVAQPFLADPGLQRSAEVRAAVSRGAILAGMTAEEVVQSRGLPLRATRTASSAGTIDQLVYRYPDGSTLRVLLRDGQVDAVTSSSGPARHHVGRR